MAATRAALPALRAAAAAAFQDLWEELGPQFLDEIARLERAHAGLGAEASPEAWRDLLTCAHDLKGLGAMCGFPLAGRMAASLERLLKRGPGAHGLLLDLHVAALRALAREGARDDAHPAGAALAAALEQAAA